MNGIINNSTPDELKTASNSKKYQDKVPEETVAKRIRQIEQLLQQKENYACYLLAMGGHTRNGYLKFKNNSGVEIIWTGTGLKKGWRILGWFIPSHAGLIKIIEPTMLSETFEHLGDGVMIGIYVFNREFEQQFIASTKQDYPSRGDTFGLAMEEDFLCYTVDTGGIGSTGNMYEEILLGEKTVSPFTP